MTRQATGRKARLGTLSFLSLQLLPSARPGSEACSEKFFSFLQMAQANAVKQSSGTAPTFIPVSAYISASVSKATGMSSVYEPQAMFPFLPRHTRSGHGGLQLAPAHVFWTLIFTTHFFKPDSMELSRMQDGFSHSNEVLIRWPALRNLARAVSLALILSSNLLASLK